MHRMQALAGAVASAFLLVTLSCARHARHEPGPRIDPAIAQAIAGIWAVDNHAHPVLPPPLDAADRDFDALPVSAMAPQSDPVALRPDNPALALPWKALYGFDAPPPLDSSALDRLRQAQQRAKTDHGENYTTWVLNQAHIGTQLANRVAMDRGVAPSRFRWVPYADALLFPLDNQGLAAATPDRQQFFALEDQLRTRYLKDAGLTTPPATLETWIQRVVIPTLERQKAGGAVAEKFELAYLRSFDFSDPPQSQAAAIYSKWIRGGTPDPAQYKLLQDFLFRTIAQECGRLGLAVHLHAMAGAGGYFGIAGVNPLLLEPLFNDPRLRATNFVLLHGGWPYVREIGALLQKPNVYLDLSGQDLLFPPHTEAQWLREWLQFEPDKVLFGTDGYPYSDELGWAESTWLASHSARQALAIALTGMLRDGEIDQARAAFIAQMVLRGNAERLYRFTSSS